MDSQANYAQSHRQARRAFIAACKQAGADAISRVHPAPAPDGKALFCDSAAFGPRDAARALLLIGPPVIAVLNRGFALGEGTRLVVVHALDPFAQAWGRPGIPADWPQKTLAAIAMEDLSQVRKLAVLAMETAGVENVLASVLPNAFIRIQAVTPQKAESAIRAAMDVL